MNKSGFILPQVLIFTLALAVVVGGYFVFRPEIKNQEQEYYVSPEGKKYPNPEEPTPTGAQMDVVNWQTYRNKKYGIEFKYPTNWIAEDYLYGSAAMQAEGRTENTGFKVYKKDNERKFTTLIIWGGPQSQGDTCELMKSRGIVYATCADIGFGKDRKGMQVEKINTETKKVFDGILDTLKFTPSSASVPPELAVTLPNGEERYSFGDTILIRWSSLNVSPNTDVVIDLVQPTDTIAGGWFVNSVAELGREKISAGKYFATLPKDISFGEYKIRIRVVGDETGDVSDRVFNIAIQ